jgi:hypothetical protein
MEVGQKGGELLPVLRFDAGRKDPPHLLPPTKVGAEGNDSVLVNPNSLDFLFALNFDQSERAHSPPHASW